MDACPAAGSPGTKHDTHGFEIDIPGTDSYRFRELGAEVVGISSPWSYVWQVRTGDEPNAWLSRSA